MNNQYMPQKFKVSKKNKIPLSSAQVLQRKNTQKAYRRKKYSESTQNTNIKNTVSSLDKSVGINSSSSDKVLSSAQVFQHENMQKAYPPSIYKKVSSPKASLSSKNFLSKSINTASTVQKNSRKGINFAYKNIHLANDLYNEIQSTDNEKNSSLSSDFGLKSLRVLYKYKEKRYKSKQKLSSAQKQQRKLIRKERKSQTAKKSEEKIYDKLVKIIKSVVKKIIKKIKSLVSNPFFWIVAGIITLILGVFIFISAITGALFTSGFNIVLSSSYLSDADDMVDINNEYDTYENTLQNDINNIEENYPNFDEYIYNVDGIYHDPHALASYLTVIYEAYNLQLVSEDIVNLFNMQYEYDLEITTEIIITTETETIVALDDDGNEIFMDIEIETEEEYKVLTVNLVNNSLNNVVTSLLSEDEVDYYNILISASGNYPYLFGGVDDSGTSVDITDVVFITTSRVGDLNIANIAISQVGNVGGEPYWSWYGFNYRVEWCACFVSWVLDQASYDGIKFAGCSQGVAYFKNIDIWVGYNTTNIAAGDIIFFDWKNDGDADHVGIVIGTDGEYVYTVEGNSGDECKIRKYSLNSNYIFGYGLMS